MLNVTEVLGVLQAERPVFHSEADFQHALAWEIHKRLPNAEVRLELPVAHAGKLLHVDIWVTLGKRILALELKYKTRRLSLQINGEHFNLLDHSAQDTGRYDFIKDIQRLERLLEGQENAEGYAILLTNDSSYWTQPRGERSVDAEFRIHEGRHLTGVLQWKPNASVGTMRGREAVLDVRGDYLLQWQDYTRLAEAGYGTLRSLTVRV